MHQRVPFLTGEQLDFINQKGGKRMFRERLRYEDRLNDWYRRFEAGELSPLELLEEMIELDGHFGGSINGPALITNFGGGFHSREAIHKFVQTLRRPERGDRLLIPTFKKTRYQNLLMPPAEQVSWLWEVRPNAVYGETSYIDPTQFALIGELFKARETLESMQLALTHLRKAAKASTSPVQVVAALVEAFKEGDQVVYPQHFEVLADSLEITDRRAYDYIKALRTMQGELREAV